MSSLTDGQLRADSSMARDDDPDLGVQHGGPGSSRMIPHDKMKLPEPKEKKAFLDYHFDVRSLIYDAFFSSEFCGLSLPLIVADPGSYKTDFFWDATRGIGNPMTRMTAHHKVSLLITCKAILNEARPFFYRAHVFHIKLLDKRRCRLGPFLLLPSHVQKSLQAITKIYLTDQPTKLTSAANANVATYIAFLTLACANLKSLILDAAMFYEKLGNDYSDTAFALSELWPRLDYLRLRVQYSAGRGWEAHRNLIAPGFNWHLEKDVEWRGFTYGRHSSEVQRRVFYLDRAHLKQDEEVHSEDTSSDSSASTSDEDSTDSDDKNPAASQANNATPSSDGTSTEGSDDGSTDASGSDSTDYS